MIESLLRWIEWAQQNKRTAGIGLGIFLLVFVIVNLQMYHYSETPEFCGTLCHEMDIHYSSFKASPHHNKHVHNCHACHVGPGIGGFLHAKLSDGLHDTKEHLKGTFTDGRVIEIADDSVPVVNINCVNCHSKKDYTKDPTHLPAVAKSTKKLSEGIFKVLWCTECHAGLVHPHMPGDLFKAYTEMKKAHPQEKIEPVGTFKDVECLGCHKNVTPQVVKEWTNGLHAQKGVTCDACHGNDHTVIKERRGQVPANTCSPCHEKAYGEFAQTKHATGRTVAQLPHTTVTTKELSMYLCKDCHRFSQIRPWDQSGVDCYACHTGHTFSKAQAQESKACEKCHIGGPDHSQLDMKETSLHGRFYSELRAKTGKAPSCQTCHGSEKTHNFEHYKLPEALKGI